MSKPRALKNKPRKALPPVPAEPIELLVRGAAQLTDLIRELGQLRDHRKATEVWLDNHGGDGARKEISALMVGMYGDKYSLIDEVEATAPDPLPADEGNTPPSDDEQEEADPLPADSE